MKYPMVNWWTRPGARCQVRLIFQTAGGFAIKTTVSHYGELPDWWPLDPPAFPTDPAAPREG